MVDNFIQFSFQLLSLWLTESHNSCQGNGAVYSLSFRIHKSLENAEGEAWDVNSAAIFVFAWKALTINVSWLVT